MVSLEEVQRRLVAKKNPRPAVSITFDDGYDANCDEAIPLLIGPEDSLHLFRQQPLRARRDSVSARRGQRNVHGPPEHARRKSGRWRPPASRSAPTRARTPTSAGCTIRAKLHDEVVGSGRELQQALGRPVRYFAFPYGQPENMNAAAFQLAQEHGYEAVCSAYGGYNFPGDDPFHIQRIYPDNMLRLKNWLTVDPRKNSPPLSLRLPSGAASEPDRVPAR